jgi:hypothetical protein
MPERFHTGWNRVFQEPTEEPACHPTWSEAAESLKECMLHYADRDDTEAIEDVDWDLVTPDRETAWFNSDEAPAMVATVQSILRDDPPEEPNNYLAVVEDHTYRHIGFWLRKVMCEEPGHLEPEA